VETWIRVSGPATADVHIEPSFRSLESRVVAEENVAGAAVHIE
jgi:hypothetical protein